MARQVMMQEQMVQSSERCTFICQEALGTVYALCVHYQKAIVSLSTSSFSFHQIACQSRKPLWGEKNLWKLSCNASRRFPGELLRNIAIENPMIMIASCSFFRGMQESIYLVNNTDDFYASSFRADFWTPLV